ncbi:MAG: phosphatidate cytidylyltransferase [Clostridia bacterium]|nr:phosphatidate cytidylyltransferase [Clostridia bacterium]
MRYATAAVLIAAILALVIWGLPWFFAALSLIICLVAAWEMCAALKNAGYPPVMPLAISAVPIVFLLLFLGQALWAAVAVAAMLLALLCMRVFQPDMPLHRLVSTVFVWAYPSLPVWGLALLGFAQPVKSAQALIILAIGASAFADSIAMFGGMLFGKHKLCPRVSPKKTVEGLAFQIFGGVFGALACYFVFRQWFPGTFFDNALWWQIITIGLLVAGVTTLGDLCASSIKRACKIKDFGHLLPGHGGMLDRVDGIMWAACAVWFYAKLVGWIA